jgi:flagellar biosynthesis/type III secretory pathway M-ring protein FliF/YscJ
MSEENYKDAVSAVISKTDSEIILLMVLFLVGLVLVVLPLYRLIIRDRREQRETAVKREKEKNDAEIEREKRVIDVIKENTEVMGSVKVLLKTTARDTKTSLVRIHKRIDEQAASVSAVQSSLDEIKSDTGRILEILDKED